MRILYAVIKKCPTWALLIFSALHLIFAGEHLIGSPAPDFTLPDTSANSRNEFILSRHFSSDSARPVVICFFATWCELCQQELRLMKSLTDSLYRGRIVMVAVSIDSAYGPHQRKFVKWASLTCRVLIDKGENVAHQYGMKKMLPYSVFITRKGVVFTTVSGYSVRARRYIESAVKKMMEKG
jgi:peroxiredoxin